MYLLKVTIKDSPIEGKGVFSLEDIAEGAIVWKFDSAWDKTLSVEEFQKLNFTEKEALLRIAYLSSTTHHWVFPPIGDPALFTNHKKESNLSVVYDISVSEEPFFQANKYINAGEELTVNYFEFDSRPRNLIKNF